MKFGNCDVTQGKIELGIVQFETHNEMYEHQTEVNVTFSVFVFAFSLQISPFRRNIGKQRLKTDLNVENRLKMDFKWWRLNTRLFHCKFNPGRQARTTVLSLTCEGKPRRIFG